MSIKVNLDPLDSVAAFFYLGRTVVYNKIYWVDLYHNLGKARRRWGVVLGVLEKTRAEERSWEIIYKALM